MTPRQKQYLKREDVLLALFQYSFRSYLLFLLLFAIGCLPLCYISLEPLGPYIYTSRNCPSYFPKKLPLQKHYCCLLSSSNQHRVLVVALLLGLYLSSPRAMPANLPESSLFRLIAASPRNQLESGTDPNQIWGRSLQVSSDRVWAERRVCLCNWAMPFSVVGT